MSVTVELSELDADLWDAFMRGGPWIAHSKYMQLKAENDKLQNDADLLRAMLSQVQTEKQCYMAENAKLRELVDYVTPIAWYAASERERDRMRELGVEVDE